MENQRSIRSASIALVLFAYLSYPAKVSAATGFLESLSRMRLPMVFYIFLAGIVFLLVLGLQKDSL